MSTNNTKKNITYPNRSHITNKVMKNILINQNIEGNKYESLESVPYDKQPLLIIKYGPPASGKGSENVAKEIENLGVNLNNFIVFEIDRIIESLENYRQETMNVYKSENKNNNKMEKSSKIYFSKRKNKSSGKSLNDQFEDFMIKSIKDRKNIIFETTGGSFNDNNPIKWLLELVKKEEIKLASPYKIILIYPIVTKDIIVDRVAKRASEQITRNPPFYRTMSKENLSQQIENSKHNFMFYIIPMLIYFNAIDKIITFKNY
jgi:hypothetical protein